MSSRIAKKGAEPASTGGPSKQTTQVTCLVAAGVLTAIMHAAGEIIRSSPPLIIGAGFTSAIVFFFLVTALGASIEAPIGWTHLLLTLLVATINAGLVHRICATTCIIFSSGVIGYLWHVSSTVYSR